ncbi:hypothetical protein K9U40_04920 [Xanthobacter autotrophicus]|uniref:hypothetical protein n=1 Tax=Xanthobacter TaxID=279 RepID=UPI0024ABAA44|nr:hypothetical protein [Xanthobacter autotrophicus]MDI4663675.1 hypothetical protein [Xanthobacter autotrophicus]
MAAYIDDVSYNNLVEFLSLLKPDPRTGRIDRDEIILALGERADIWPRGIIPDVARAWWHACNPHSPPMSEAE